MFFIPDGLVVEQFCYKVGIILSNLVPFCSPDQQQKVSLKSIIIQYPTLYVNASFVLYRSSKLN